MTHVYPHERERDRIWIGEHMLGAHGADAPAPREHDKRDWPSGKGAHHH